MITTYLPHYASLTQKTIKQPTEERTVEQLWSALSLEQKVLTLYSIKDGKDRKAFFYSLSKEEQNSILSYITKSQEQHRKKMSKECMDVMNQMAGCDLNVMALYSLIAVYAKKLDKKMENQKLTTKSKFKFTLPRYIKMYSQEVKNLYKICIKKESGVMTQLMTQALPYYWKEYEQKGNFFMLFESKFPSLILKDTEHLYVTMRKFCNKFTDDHADIATCALLIGCLAQCIKVTINDSNKIIKEIYQKGNTGRVRWKEPYYPDPDIANDLAFACEKICVGIMGNDYGVEKNISPIKKAYNVWKKKFSEADYYDMVNECVDYSINTYMYNYLARMVCIVQQGKDMPQGVKEDMNFLFQSNMGYCRVMRDIKMLAKMIDEEDLMDIADSIKELSVQDKSLYTIRAIAKNVMEVWHNDNFCNEEYMDRLYFKELDDAKKKYEKAI